MEKVTKSSAEDQYSGHYSQGKQMYQNSKKKNSRKSSENLFKQRKDS